jgi:hypothetical protein
MSAGNDTSAVIAVILGGTNVPLPNGQALQGISVDGTNTLFTVANTGTYLVNFKVQTTAAILASARVLVNGAPLTNQLTFVPTVATNLLSDQAFVSLTAGDILELELYGIIGAVTLIGEGGTEMVVQQIR